MYKDDQIYGEERAWRWVERDAEITVVEGMGAALVCMACT